MNALRAALLTCLWLASPCVAQQFTVPYFPPPGIGYDFTTNTITLANMTLPGLTGILISGGSGGVSTIADATGAAQFLESFGAGGPYEFVFPLGTATNAIVYAVDGAFTTGSDLEYTQPGTTAQFVLGGANGAAVLRLNSFGGLQAKLQLESNVNTTMVTLQNLTATSSYTFNFPINAGTSGQALISGGGGTNVMTWLTLAASATTDTTNAGNISSGTLSNSRLSGVALLAASATTSAIGGSLLAAGGCSSTAVSATGSTTAMAVQATPVTYPGDGNYWLAYVSAAGTVTVKVCAAIAGTPTSSAYNVRVLQ